MGVLLLGGRTVVAGIAVSVGFAGFVLGLGPLVARRAGSRCISAGSKSGRARRCRRSLGVRSGFARDGPRRRLAVGGRRLGNGAPHAHHGGRGACAGRSRVLGGGRAVGGCGCDGDHRQHGPDSEGVDGALRAHGGRAGHRRGRGAPVRAARAGLCGNPRGPAAPWLGVRRARRCAREGDDAEPGDPRRMAQGHGQGRRRARHRHAHAHRPRGALHLVVLTDRGDAGVGLCVILGSGRGDAIRGARGRDGSRRRGRERGVALDHSTIYRWVQRFAPEVEKRLRWQWRRPQSTSWRIDETYVKVHGKWTYLYRALDKLGNTIDFYLSATRNTKAAKRFLGKALRDCPVPSNWRSRSDTGQ